MTKSNPAISVEDLYKSFGSNKVLKGISVSAYKGDVISVLGSSGSGKSTLLRCINFLEIPDSGRITISGEEVHMKKGRGGQSVPRDRKQRGSGSVASSIRNRGVWQRCSPRSRASGRVP